MCGFYVLFTVYVYANNLELLLFVFYDLFLLFLFFRFFLSIIMIIIL